MKNANQLRAELRHKGLSSEEIENEVIRIKEEENNSRQKTTNDNYYNYNYKPKRNVLTDGELKDDHDFMILHSMGII